MNLILTILLLTLQVFYKVLMPFLVNRDKNNDLLDLQQPLNLTDLSIKLICKDLLTIQYFQAFHKF